MFCPRCRADLPDSATTCTRCGYPVAQAAQAAQSAQVGQVPVPSSYSSPSYSYLPPGVPQWPTAVPAQLPTAQPRTSGEVGAGDTPGSMSSGAGGRPPSRKGALGIPAILGLFIVSILIGGGMTLGLLALQGHFNQTPPPAVALHLGSTPTATASPQASPSAVGTSQTNLLPTPSTFLTIKNTDVGLSIKYPSDWVLDPVQKNGQDAFLSMHPSVQNGVFIALQKYGTTSSTQFHSTSDVNSNNLTQFQTVQGVTSVQPIQATTPQQTVGGTAWDEMDATFTTTNGNTYHLTTIAVQYKKLFYNILYYAPQQVYAEAVQKYFQPMLSSIKFLA